MLQQVNIFDRTFVEELLPQKFPFVMADKMYSYSETEIVTGYLVRPDNIFVSDGRFRESGIIEHMAQSVAMHTGYQFYLRKEKAPTGYIGSISKLEIIELPSTGEELKTEVQILQEFAGVTLVEITTTANGRPVATGQMKTILAK